MQCVAVVESSNLSRLIEFELLACRWFMHLMVHKLQHTATYCNTLQHTAPHCNTLQHMSMIHAVGGTAYCAWSVIFWVSDLNVGSRSICLFCRIPLKRDAWDRDWRLRLNDTPNAIGCILVTRGLGRRLRCIQRIHSVWGMGWLWLVVSFKI